jgi:hypothetical protein
MFATKVFFLRFLTKIEYFLKILIHRLKDLTKKRFFFQKYMIGSKDTAR